MDLQEGDASRVDLNAIQPSKKSGFWRWASAQCGEALQVLLISMLKATNKFDMPLRKPIFKRQMITEW
jgi:hypothetical protein